MKTGAVTALLDTVSLFSVPCSKQQYIKCNTVKLNRSGYGVVGLRIRCMVTINVYIFHKIPALCRTILLTNLIKQYHALSNSFTYQVFHSQFTFFLPVTFRLLSAIFFRLPLDGDTVVILHRCITLVCAPQSRALGGPPGDHRRYVRVGIGPHLQSDSLSTN